MKTKNNVQKSVVRSLVVIGGLVLISATLVGQTLQFKDAGTPENHAIAMTSSMEAKNVKATEVPANVELLASNAAEQDAPLEIENWMLNDENFEMKAPTKKETKDRKIALIMENTNKKFGRRLFVIFEEEDE